MLAFFGIYSTFFVFRKFLTSKYSTVKHQIWLSCANIDWMRQKDCQRPKSRVLLQITMFYVCPQLGLQGPKDLDLSKFFSAACSSSGCHCNCSLSGPGSGHNWNKSKLQIIVTPFVQAILQPGWVSTIWGRKHPHTGPRCIRTTRLGMLAA